MATKPPKLTFEAFKDKREAVEIWLDQFNDWCILQSWRDTSKPTSDHDHWKEDCYAKEISAFRLGMPPEVLRNIKTTVVPMMGNDDTAADALDRYSGYPWVWQKLVLRHYSGQDTVLAERMTFLDTCKQKPHETIAEFEARCKYHGRRCEYSSMNNPEEELIRDRFVTGVRDDKLRAELLRHKKEDGTTVTLAEVVNKAKAWEAAMMTNAKVIEAKQTEEQVHFSSSPGRSGSGFTRRSSRNHGNGAGRHGHDQRQHSSFEQRGSRSCGFCGANERHSRRNCPANKPGVVCSNCGGRNHFTTVCRSPKDYFKRRSSTQPTHALDHAASAEEDSGDDLEHFCLDESVHALPSSASKLFTTLSLSVSGDSFVDVKFQVDSAATCNTLPYHQFKKIGKDSDLQPTSSKLISYSGEAIRPLGKVTLVHQNPQFFMLMDFHVVDLPRKPALLGLPDSSRLSLLHIDSSRVTTQSDQQPAPHLRDCDEISTSVPLTKDDMLKDYQSVFSGLGNVGKPVSFVLDPHVVPVQAPIHRIPVTKRERVKLKLDEMVRDGKLAKVEEPTDWCSNMTVVERIKSDGSIKTRLCLDPSQTINKAIVIPKFTVPTLDEILPALGTHKHKCFTIVDALDGFTQVPLCQQSSLVTTMHTPWGRYRWLRLPYGVSSAPEEFQMRMQEALDGLNGVGNIADDILVYGLGDSPAEAEADHDRNLRALLGRAQERDLKLNPTKIQFKLVQLKFMGHHVSEDGVSPDPAKVDAILQFPQPTNKPALQRFLGMANYLNAFCPNLSSVIHPLFQLTRKDADFQWSSVHTSAFEAARKLIADAPCLAFFDQHKPVTLQVDASDYGLGGALMQADSSGKLQPVAYMSCQLKPNEVQWAQIEKEALAICAACTKWDLWLYGKAVTVHSDHQALETIFKKPLAKAPKRLQRIMFRLQRYTINVIYLKGTSLVLADTLSRAPLSVSNDASPTNFDLFRLNVERQDLQPNVHLTSSTAKAMQHATASDPDMNQLLQVVMTGWPSSKASLPACLTPYWSMRDELSIVDGILYRGLQVLVPPSLRSSMLKKIHSSHMGADSNYRMCRDILYWPGMKSSIQDLCASCGQCAQYGAQQPREPMQSVPVPQFAWQLVSQDIFHYNSRAYLVTVDHYSDFFEVDLLPDTLAATVVAVSSVQFARHGIPETLLTDNGPQFISAEFASFCTALTVEHKTSSPYWPQGNGKAESAVKVAKSLLKKSADSIGFQLALLDYRNTPPQGHTLSPAQRSMGRRTRQMIPAPLASLMPLSSTSSLVQDEILARRQRAAITYDNHHRVQASPLSSKRGTMCTSSPRRIEKDTPGAMARSLG